jgi:hypothetical protein
MPVNFSADAIFARISGRIEAAVSETAQIIAMDAQERAPVRKVFQGSVGRATLQTPEEVAAEVHERTAQGLAPGPVRTQRTPAAAVHAFGPRRVLAAPGRLLVQTPLTTRGRYELRVGRANIKVGKRTYLGGRLRSEIRAMPASGGPLFIAKVISPTPYAKYVEYGTRRSRAQPYLRPAIAAQATAFRERLLKAVS